MDSKFYRKSFWVLRPWTAGDFALFKRHNCNTNKSPTVVPDVLAARSLALKLKAQLKNSSSEPCMVVHICKLRAWKASARGWPHLWSAWAARRVQGQSELHCDTLLQNNQSKSNKRDWTSVAEQMHGSHARIVHKQFVSVSPEAFTLGSRCQHHVLRWGCSLLLCKERSFLACEVSKMGIK